MPLSQFNAEGRVVAFESRVLGCEVVLAADGVALPVTETRPVYRVVEVRQILDQGLGFDAMRQTHAVKAALNGTIIGSKDDEQI